MNAKIFHLQAISALHVGTGQGVGVVDLPIARAKASNLPHVPASAIKGVMRDEAAAQLGLSAADIKTLFGPESSTGDSHAGALAFGDAQLLLLPVRSFSGIFAYATCPFILRRYKRDLALDFDIPTLNHEAETTASSKLLLENDRVALEDLDIKSDYSQTADDWAEYIANALYPHDKDWQKEIQDRFIILPDSIFSFLADTATEIRTRIRIVRETRIVKDGALWTEENLPAESILWGVMGISQARDNSGKSAADLAALLKDGEYAIQIGGKHTIGRGLCRFILQASKEPS